jgi:lipoprotein-releasing system permease protein
MWQLAWRFRSSKQQNGFISFISASSTMGIGLGCCVLILLLSVMNGFEYELKERLLSVIPHGELYALDPKGIDHWQEEIKRLQQNGRFESIEPYTKATGMLQKGSKMKSIELTGIAPEYAQQNKMIANVSADQWQAFTHNDHGVLLGQGVMQQLQLKLGDRVQLLLPQTRGDLSLKALKSIWLTVYGIVKIGGELDNHIGYMHLSLASQSLGVTHGAQGIRFRFDEPFQAPQLTRKIGYDFTQGVYMSDWTRTQGHLYQDIQLVRVVVYIALSLVIGVACFNIVSTLVMAVNEKQAEIAMLKSMGARDSLIIGTFMLQGLINGVLGTVCGLVLGVVFALNLAEMAQAIERVVGVQFLSGDIYFIDFLPSRLNWSEVYLAGLIAITLSLFATIYPARKAAKINPARVLGH